MGKLIHGLRRRKDPKPAEYLCWQSMISRCHGNPSRKGYERYGGRGIIVCQKWRDSFTEFLKDVGPRPSSSHSLERIENDGNYEPGNVRWATPREQSRNTRRNVLITWNGKTQTVTDWAAELGINFWTLYRRLVKEKWPLEDAMTAASRYGWKRKGQVMNGSGQTVE